MNEKDEKETLKPSKSVRNWMKSKKHKNAILCSTQCRETCSISQIRHDTARHDVVRTKRGFFSTNLNIYFHCLHRFYPLKPRCFRWFPPKITWKLNPVSQTPWYTRFWLAARTNSAWSLFENHNKLGIRAFFSWKSHSRHDTARTVNMAVLKARFATLDSSYPTLDNTGVAITPKRLKRGVATPSRSAAPTTPTPHVFSGK